VVSDARLLNSFSTLQIALMFVVGAAVLSLAAVWIAETLHGGDLGEGTFDEASSAVLATFTLLFGLLLALTIAGLTSRDSSARSAVQREATALPQLTRTSQPFKPATRVRFKAAIAQYDHAVVEDEFVTMKSGHQSALVAGALQNLYAVYQSYNPTPTEWEPAI
jgi:hypothetical protein